MIYKFNCNKCQKEVEVNCKVSEYDKATCPECGSHSIERVWSGLRQSWNCEGSYSGGTKG